MKIITRGEAMRIHQQHPTSRLFPFCTGKYRWHGSAEAYTGREVQDIPGVLAVFAERRKDSFGPYVRLMSVTLKDGRCLLFWQQAGISALKQELEVKTPYRAMNHPVIGVVTKADLASMEQISLVKSWLREAGAHNVLVTSAVNNNGVTELFALLHTEEGCC